MNECTEKIVGAAIEVHRTIGPGLLESAYEESLAHEMRLHRLGFQRQVTLPVTYKGVKLDRGYCLDFPVEHLVVVELKAADVLGPIRKAQMLTYLKLGNWTLGLLINFNVPLLKDGIQRVVPRFKESSAPLR